MVDMSTIRGMSWVSPYPVPLSSKVHLTMSRTRQQGKATLTPNLTPGFKDWGCCMYIYNRLLILCDIVVWSIVVL